MPATKTSCAWHELSDAFPAPGTREHERAFEAYFAVLAKVNDMDKAVFLDKYRAMKYEGP